MSPATERLFAPHKSTEHPLSFTSGLGMPGLLLPAFYVGVVIFLCWPLVTQIDTHFGGVTEFNSDRQLSAWAMAWSSQALVTDPLGIANANIYYPSLSSLFYGQIGFGALIYFSPVFWLTGNPVLALNVTLIGGLACTAWLFHIVIRDWTGSNWAGLLAGIAFLSNRYVFGYIPTAPHLAALQFFPLIAWLTARHLKSLRGTLLLSLLIALQCMTEPVYVAPGVVACVGTLAGLRFLHSESRAAGLRLLAALVLGIVLVVPIYLGYAGVVSAQVDLRAQTIWSHPFVVVQSISTVVGQKGANSMALVIFILLAFALMSLLARRGQDPENPVTDAAFIGPSQFSVWIAAGVWFVVGSLVSVGPEFALGETVISTPLHYLGQMVPALKTIRLPARAAYAALCGATLLAGLAFGELEWRLRRVSRGRAPSWAMGVTSGAAVLWLATGLYFDAGDTNTPPMAWRLSPASRASAAVIEAVRADPGPLLDLPLEPGERRLWPFWQASAMFRSIDHGQPILNGYNSYYPVDFPERMALADQLPDPAALAALVAETGLQWIALQPKSLPPQKYAAWTEALASEPPTYRLVVNENGRWLLKVLR
ncbi:MAG: hypothetical protein P8M78_02480 [Myxococcota bacterium]|nr:hypothetical protein [Myxococcota bacterium]